ncbi:hypothetical protein [Mesorhizobium sp. DCY119]|uniref:hypothetical protein n=1 Tax=Mesorhizobium sp. DCY119 TaxID=2108445 RepID=UPI0010585560|nr:hypothetical protein [Mesorhizobium sp. DCY119]
MTSKIPAPPPGFVIEEAPRDLQGPPMYRPFKSGETRPNADGSYSTEVSTTWQQPDGQWTNIPSLWMGPNGPTQFNPDDEDAITATARNYEQARGQTFPRFDSVQDAETSARSRSEQGGAGMIPPPPGFELLEMNDLGHGVPQFAPPGVEGYDPATGLVTKPAPSLSTAQAFANGAADVGTFGFGDEIAAGIGTLADMLPGGHGEGYASILDDIRSRQKAGAEQHPIANVAGMVTGGVGSGFGLARGGLSLAARAAQGGKGWFARMLGGAADGGIAAGAYGAGSGEGTAGRLRNAADNVPLGLAFGAGGEAVATGLGAVARRIFSGADNVAPGANPAANVSLAQEFGIPLSRAQATRSVPQANIENQLRSQGAMSAFDQAQKEAVGQSISDVQSRLASGAPVIPGPASAYEGVPSALRGKRDALKSASQEAYEASVNNPDVLVSGDAVRSIPDFIRGKLSADDILIDPMYHQGAARAMSFVDDYIGRMPAVGGDVKGVQAQLRWIENLRAGLRKNFPPIGQDAPALKAISGAIDDWTDDVFDKGLVSASDDVLSELKTARSKWSEYMSMADPKPRKGGRLNPQYEAQAKVRNIMDKDFSPEEIGQYLWGSSVASPKNASFMTAQELRRTLGPDSPEWNGIRQSFWLRATRAGDEALNPTQITKNLDGLLNGNGKGVAMILFSPAERDLMWKYASVMRHLSPAREGINGSNTANRLMPALQKYGTAIVGALAGGGGMWSGLGPLEALGVGAVSTGLLRGVNSVAQASRASTATRLPVPVNPSGLGGATLRGGSVPLVLGQEKRQPLQITVGRPQR